MRRFLAAFFLFFFFCGAVFGSDIIGVNFTDVPSNLLPAADDTYDIGENSTPLEWKDLYVDGTANIDTLSADAGSVAGVTIAGGTNTFSLTNGTASLDVAAAATVNIDKSLTVDGQATTITGAGQANIFTLNEAFTIGDGNAGTLTYTGASKTLSVEDTSVVNQDLTTDAGVTFAAITGNGVLTVKPDGTNEVFQVNDGTLDFSDGNAGTAGTLTVDSSGNLSYNKNFTSIDLTSTGNTTLGDAAADTLTINATLAADVNAGGYYALQLQNIPDLAAKGPSYWFDGTDDVIAVADNANLTMINGGGTDNGMSIIAIGNFRDMTNSYALSKGVYNTDMEYLFGVGATDKLHFRIADESVASCYIGRRYDTALTSRENTNIALAVTYDGTGYNAGVYGINLYVDGVVVDDINEQASQASYVAMENLTGEGRVGRYDTNYVNGELSRVILFNLELTAAEVKAYSSGAPLPYKYSEEGGSGASQTEATSGTLVLGKAYRINDWITADDFTNVGGTNVDGTEFVAAGAGCSGAVCTPTTWTNSSTVVRIGAVLDLPQSGITTAAWNGTLGGAAVAATVSGALPVNLPTEIEIQGGLVAPGILNLTTAEPTVVATNELGRIDFSAPLEASGTDAILPGASIWAVAEGTFGATSNATSLVLATGSTDAAVEKARLTSAGLWQIGTASGVAQVNITPASAIAGLYVSQAGGYPAGLHVNRNDAHAESYQLVLFRSENAATEQRTLFVDHNGTGGAIAYGLHVDSENAAGPAVKIESANIGADIGGGNIRSITTVNAGTYDLLVTDYILNVTYTDTGTVAIDLKTAQAVAGRILHIKDADFNAGTNNITISTEGAGTIDEAATYVISANGNSVSLYSDGTDWYIF